MKTKIKIHYKRSDAIFIVEYDKKFYLVNLNHKTCLIAEPPTMPDMFLKFGYFKEVGVIKEEVRQEIINLVSETVKRS